MKAAAPSSLTSPKETLTFLEGFYRSVVRLPADLSARQLAILLSVYMNPPPHTVKKLSEELSISKPAVCRALDSLSMLGLLKRKRDEKDRRNIFVQRTLKGSVFLNDLGEMGHSVLKTVFSSQSLSS
jgi:DNA-binding MarR family transcriptional regulator